MEYIHKGKDRPLIYVPNFGNVILKDGTKVKVSYNKYVYVSGYFEYDDYHRYTAYLSNFVSVLEYDFNLTDRQRTEIFINEILIGGKETPLEYQNKCIKQISKNLPKKDFVMAHYQFSNQIRPTEKVVYKNGLYSYYNTCKPTDKNNLARYIYRNLYKILPDGVDDCTAEMYENLPDLYESKYKQNKS